MHVTLVPTDGPRRTPPAVTGRREEERKEEGKRKTPTKEEGRTEGIEEGNEQKRGGRDSGRTKVRARDTNGGRVGVKGERTDKGTVTRKVGKDRLQGNKIQGERTGVGEVCRERGVYSDSIGNSPNYR